MSGWICLHRGIQSHWIYADANKLKAWLDLLLTANIEDKKFMIKSQMITCKRGQLAVSQKTLEQRWKWSRNQVRHFLELLENDGMITIESNHLTSIITICNYREFQDLQPAKGTAESTSEGTAEGTAEGKQLNNRTIKQLNKKEIDSPKRTVSSLLSDFGINGQLAKDFIALRKEKKAAITETALNRMKTQSVKAGLSMQEAVEICIERNWQGFNADWYQEKPKTVLKQVITEADINRAARPGETRDQVYKRLQAALG